MTDTDTPTRAEFETAMHVLETFRDEKLPEEAVGRRRALNEAHAVLDDERDQLDDDWDVPDGPEVQTRLSLRDLVRCTEAAAPYGAGYDLVGTTWLQDHALQFEWVDADAEPRTDGGADECEIGGCTDSVEHFDEPFTVPPGVPHRGDGRAVMCDHHHVAARIFAYTRPDPPYVDVGLYQEVTYYSRALAAETFGLPSQEHVIVPEEADDGGDE